MEELPEGWSRHVAPSGHYYYYNSKTGESTYDKPLCSSVEKKRRRPHKPADRPKLKIDLADGWVLVFCRSGRRFVHNCETSQSYWNAPEQVAKLVEALDRDLVIENIARARGLKYQKEQQRAREEPADTAEPAQLDPKLDLTANYENPKPDLIVNYESDDSVSDSDNESDKPSGSDKGDKAHGSDGSDESESSEGEFEFEDSEDSEEEEMPEEEKQKRFGEMLAENGISALSTWQLEMNKLVNDPRYDLFSSLQQRQDAFDAWATQQIAATKKPSASSSATSPEQKFVDFVVSEYSPKFKFYLDFKRKLRKDPRFSDSPLSDRDKETLFRHTSKALKLPEPERQEKLKQLY